MIINHFRNFFYDNNLRMDPNIWGPKFWFSLHSVSFTYPFYPDEADKLKYKSFFQLLEFTLPCVVCRVNYAKNLKSHPIEPHLKDRKSLAHWVIDIHNMVNIENGKPALTYKEVIKIYESIYERKIYLEDPEPHITQGKKLSDEEWKRNQEMRTIVGRFKTEIRRYWIIAVLIFLIALLVLSICMILKK